LLGAANLREATVLNTDLADTDLTAADLRGAAGPAHLNVANTRLVAMDATKPPARPTDDPVIASGADHPGTLIIRHQIAMERADEGDSQGAAEALEELLDDLTRVIGPDDPQTLATRSDLARLRGQAGDAAAAATALAAVLEQMLNVLGEDHPDTIATRDDLTYWEAEAGEGNAE
jgi:uncharacterized protein YjbI with pentapeptide repeats